MNFLDLGTQKRPVYVFDAPTIAAGLVEGAFTAPTPGATYTMLLFRIYVRHQRP